MDDVIRQGIGDMVAGGGIAQQRDFHGWQIREAIRLGQHAHAGPHGAFRQHADRKPGKHHSPDGSGVQLV